MRLRKTPVYWWNEDQDKLQFGEGDIVLVPRQNLQQHLRWQQLCQPKHLVV